MHSHTSLSPPLAHSLSLSLSLSLYECVKNISWNWEQLSISLVSIYEWIGALSEYVALSLHLLLMANLY